MLEQFQNHLHAQFPFLQEKKLLIATSGGLDSMVLVHLLIQLPYQIAIAHCNFQLRGIESFEDQKFVQEYAEEQKIPFFTTIFDTKAFAKEYQLSTQVAARELRYNWFYELLETNKYDYILTAHHADDNLETFIINLSRGTGLEGLCGIPTQNEKVIRPLLVYPRAEMEAYADLHQVLWREDSSNASDTYLRNKIRHEIVPVLKENLPNLMQAFQKSQSHLQEAKTMVEDATIMIYQQVATEKGDDIHFNIQKLKQLPNYESYLYQWVKEFGFTDWAAIAELVERQSGKQVFSKDFRLLKDREVLILSPRSEPQAEEYFIVKGQQDVNFPLNISFCKVTDISPESNSSIFVDENKLVYPLQIRRWKQGDVFYPFGMKGQSKKISKFFKDEKLSLMDKENSWLLCSDNQIVWVIGYRSDERFKIEETTQQLLKIAVH